MLDRIRTYISNFIVLFCHLNYQQHVGARLTFRTHVRTTFPGLRALLSVTEQLCFALVGRLSEALPWRNCNE